MIKVYKNKRCYKIKIMSRRRKLPSRRRSSPRITKAATSDDLGAGNGDDELDKILNEPLPSLDMNDGEEVGRNDGVGGDDGRSSDEVNDELEAILREYGDDNDLKPIIGDEKWWSPLYMTFIVIIIIGIVINLVLLYDLKGRDRSGKLIENESKDMAAVNGIGLAIILTIILGGSIYLVRKGRVIEKSGTTLIILILIAFLIIFLMGLFVGEYVNVGHVWAPIVNLQPSG